MSPSELLQKISSLFSFGSKEKRSLPLLTTDKWYSELYLKKKALVDTSAIDSLTNVELADRIENHIWSVGGPYTDLGNHVGIWFVYLEAAARLRGNKPEEVNETVNYG
jgi:hypothetical protein